MYVVTGDTVYHSDPYNFDTFRFDNQWLRFPGQVVMFEAVNDGIYVGTSQAVSFLPGDRPDKFVPVDIFDYGVIDGTAVRTEAAFFDTQAQGEDAGEQPRPAVAWTSKQGVCVGRDGGAAVNLTETKYSFPAAERGAGLIRQDRGYITYISALQGTSTANNSYT